MKSFRQLVTVMTLVFFIFSCKEKEKQSPAPNKATGDTTLNITTETDANPYATVDISPMDMSYYPIDYPKLKMANNNIPPPVVRIVYSRPHLQGRHLFNEVLKYGENWRLGANESTEIQFYRDVTIQGKKIKPGRYVLYCIPQADKWTLVLNSNIDSWGLKQDSARDIQKFDIPAVHDHNGSSLEFFTIVFEKAATGADMLMAWGDVMAKLPINF
jgi:hypothetical protein